MSGRRDSLFEAHLEAETLAIYWRLQYERYTLISDFLRILIIVASSGTVATLWILQPHSDILKGIAASASILSIIHAAIFPPEKFVKATNLIALFKELAIKYGILWAEDESLSNEEHWKEYRRLRETKIDQTVFRQSQSLLDRAVNEALADRNRKSGGKS